MAATGLEVFDKTPQTTNTWLNEGGERTGADRQSAWHALGAVLHALRNRVPAVGPTGQGAHAAGFLDRVGDGLAGSVDPRGAAQAVFRVLSRRMAPGQAGELVKASPQPAQDLWTEVAVARFPANDQRRRGGTSAA